MFAAVASHGTIVGTAREIALIEFFRDLIPRRYEVLSGAIAAESVGGLEKATNQLDVIVVDTFDYPTLLRTGDLAVVLAASVLAVVESKSNLARGKEFLDAMVQIGRARLLAGGGTLTALFCFGDPATSTTLRKWLDDVLRERKKLIRDAAASAKPSAATKKSAKKSTPAKTPKELMALASNYSAAALPDLVISDRGAIAIRFDVGAGAKVKTKYRFYETSDHAPTVVALASKVLGHLSEDLRSQVAQNLGTGVDGTSAASAKVRSFAVLTNQFDASIKESGDKDLDVTDLQPK